MPGARAPQKGKPAQQEACAPRLETTCGQQGRPMIQHSKKEKRKNPTGANQSSGSQPQHSACPQTTGGQTSDLLALDILPHHPDKMPTEPVLRRRLYLVLITSSLREMGGKIKGPAFWVRVVAEQRGGPLLLFSCSVVSDSLQPYGLQHARLPCPSPSPRACSNSCPLSL